MKGKERGNGGIRTGREMEKRVINARNGNGEMSDKCKEWKWRRE